MQFSLDKNFETYIYSAVDISRKDLIHIVDALHAFYDSTVHEFIQTRHSELQKQGFRNSKIFKMIQGELLLRRFSASPLTIRQIRRKIYG